MNDVIVRLDKKFKENGECELGLYLSMEALKTVLLSKLSGNDFKVFIAIASFIDDKGECCPSQETLSIMTGVSPVTINKSVNSLLKIKIGNTNILTRKLVNGKGTANYSVYRIPFIGEIEAQDTATEKPLNTTEIMKIFKEKYAEKYKVEYKPNYRIEMSLIKKTLLTSFTDEQIRIILDIVFEEYDKRWKNASYPAPTIGAICSWMGNQALKVYMDKQSQSRSKWDDYEDEEDLIL